MDQHGGLQGSGVANKLIERYGEEEWRSYQLPYIARLLRFDVKSEIWIRLRPIKNILPKAQSIACVDRIEDGALHLLIAGGYGSWGRSRCGSSAMKNDMRSKFHFLNDLEIALGFTSTMMTQTYSGTTTIVPQVCLRDFIQDDERSEQDKELTRAMVEADPMFPLLEGGEVNADGWHTPVITNKVFEVRVCRSVRLQAAIMRFSQLELAGVNI